MRVKLDVVRTTCWMWLCVVLGGCLSPNTSSCGDRICPRGSVCAAAFGHCVTAESMTACAGLADGTECTTARGDGMCRSAVCIPFTCGDGIITTPEECDGDNVGAQTCLTAQFYDDGPVACAPDCTLDVSQCTGYCGDGVVQEGEACDGEPAACQSLGYYDPGVATCTERCTLNASACTGRCGDDMVNGPETCDGGDPQLQCTSFGYDYGPTSCAGNCAASFLACGRIGWHRDPVAVPIARLDAIGPWTFGGSYEGVVLRFNEHTSHVDVLPGENGFAQGFAGTAGDDVYTATTTGRIYHYDGASWQLVYSTPDGGALADIHGTASAAMWAVGAAGTIYRLDELTVAWQPDAASGMLTTNNLAAVFSITEDDAIAVGAAGTILVRNAGGWSSVTPAQAVADLSSVWASSATDVYVGGGRGVLLHWDGQAWAPNTELPLVKLGAAHQVLITGTSSTNVFVVQSVTNTSSAVTIERVWNFDSSDWLEIEPSGYGLGIRDVTITVGGQLVVTGIQGAFGIATLVGRFHSAGASLRRPSSPPSIRGTWAHGRDFFVAVGGVEGFLTPTIKHVLMFDGTSWTDDASFGQGMFASVWGFDRASV
jgi:hypothetical protein